MQTWSVACSKQLKHVFWYASRQTCVCSGTELVAFGWERYCTFQPDSPTSFRFICMAACASDDVCLIVPSVCLLLSLKLSVCLSCRLPAWMSQQPGTTPGPSVMNTKNCGLFSFSFLPFACHFFSSCCLSVSSSVCLCVCVSVSMS